METRMAVDAARRFEAISSLAMESARLAIASSRVGGGYGVGGGE